MESGTSLTRHWLLLRMLANRRYGLTVRELADELRVSVKTVRRDLQTLAQVGFPLAESVGEFGRKSWTLEATSRPFELAFSYDEALALYLARQQLEPLRGTLVWESAEQAFRKIRAMLSAQALKYLERFSETPQACPAGFPEESSANLLSTLRRESARESIFSLDLTGPGSVKIAKLIESIEQLAA